MSKQINIFVFMLREEVSRLMDFYPKIYFACHTRHVTDKESGVKLTANQASILNHLDTRETITLFDLAMHMGVSPSTMSIAINKLVKLKLVKRVKDKTDKRKTNLSLTAEGDKIKKSHSVLDAERVNAVLARLNSVERKLAMDGLGLLAYAAGMEMKSKSIEQSWSKRNTK